MAKRPGKGDPSLTIVIRREEEGEEHAHHGGAWKIAYADFVTAMMAFFLLMWLINATTDAQRRGLADYFAPTNILGRAASGSGEPFGGRTMNSDRTLAGETPPSGGVQMALPAMPLPAEMTEQDEEDTLPPEAARSAYPLRRPAPEMAMARRVVATAEQEAQAAPPPGAATHGPEREALEREALDRAAAEIRRSVADDPQLAELAPQLMLEQVREGLRIQLVDAEGQPVFAAGQAAPNARGRALLMRVAAVVARLPNPVDISGHTDATPFRGNADRSNWDLSAERAGATRRLLVEAGVAEERIRAVTGRADRELLRPERPEDAANRRASILVALPETPRPADPGASR